MTTDQIILFSLFGAVFGLLLWGRFRYDIVAFAALMTGVVLGVVDTKHAFDGFGHPATLIVALVLVVSAGLVRSGAVLLITRTLVDASRSLGAHITLMGAVGGMGGLPTALAELPVTTTLLLRVINGVAAEHGFDPTEDNVRFDCVHVFTAAGPLDHDDSADIAFLSARMALSGAAMQSIITRVAPRLATVLGQKLAAQAVPVFGAVAGAATNYAYTSYYTDMAHVHFGLRRLAVEADQPREVLVAKLRMRMARQPVKRA